MTVGAVRERRRLVEVLRREDALSDPAWISAFRRVPRHVFLPRFFVPDNSGWAAVAEGDDGWLQQVYADRVLVTQLDDDPSGWARARRGGPIPGTPTCSSSMPAIMAIMLEELRVTDGDRVLEVGSGTGYNAALLCRRLGASHVSTVDIDAHLVHTARRALARCGYAPSCEVYDGAQGFPPNAPYDRVLCTCAVSCIPPAWLEQTRPGGLVVTTLNRPIGAGLVRIVAQRGPLGTGRVLARDGRFMPLRAHRLADPERLVAALPDRRDAAAGKTTLPIGAVVSPSSRFEFFAGLQLPDVSPVHDPADRDATFLVHADGSWARHRAREGDYLVEQGGPRRLWDIVEAAYATWRSLGEPSRDRFGVTVTPDGQEIWLDTPGSPHRWPLVASDWQR
ncbi:ATP-grasp peptide maturase system methyltransferase [Amycolatopsis anabasis]|uniref:ATP-grasp peptide maturase system methyltransferase n=1 Tax=Amycolatopsis anabasis TaxID=1840409 RepID=UPI00131B7E35|nr:ATP-grasp peptide maturase system methyltransferase [Amycolatopsis anabasis]